MDAVISASPIVKQMGEVRHGIGGKKGSAFTNDGSYKSVESQLSRLAFTCFSRAEKLNLNLELKDVRQEMDKYYLLAYNAWDPTRGVKFNTYLHSACLRNFNHFIEKMVAERTHLGMYSYDGGPSSLEDELEGATALERTVNSASEDSPEDGLAARQHIKAVLAELTPAAKRFVTALMLSETGRVEGGARFSAIAAAAGLKGAELKRVKVEITQKFGFTEW